MPPARITVRRELEWMDTDAAGIWHYSTVLRFIEHAEYELHRELGTHEQTIGHAPRVHIEVDFHAPVRFAEEVTTTLTVAKVGTTSISYDALLEGSKGLVARASITCVLVSSLESGPLPIPPDIRKALCTGNPI